MANLGYRLFNGSTDELKLNLGNLASAASGDADGETWMFAGRILGFTTSGEIISSPGYDPLDFYVAPFDGTTTVFQFYDGATDSGNGITATNTALASNDQIVVARRKTGTVARFSYASNPGTWGTFAHANAGVVLAGGNYPGSGTLDCFNNAALNARCALLARCSTFLSDAEVATLTTDTDSWLALSSVTNCWQMDGATVVDLKGTATQNTLTGTTVTATAFSLAAPTGGGAPAAIDVPALIVPNAAVTRSYYW